MEQEPVQLPEAESPQFRGDIRAIEESDLDSLRPILEHWIRDPETGEPAQEEIQQDLEYMRASAAQQEGARQYFVAATKEDGVVGVVGLKTLGRLKEFAKTDRPLQLVNMYVASDQRGGKGTGRALLARLEAAAKEQQSTEIVISSGPRYEQSGWPFYDKMGYQRIGLIENLFGEGIPGMVWRKDLAD